ncbi:hypothetical protein [Amniculibacterium sp. G2-70]|uniref:hypothetical protein n=1 Tax=Amniculibacterium sp. G2-70 TaxID=2767188 RepID=UPI00165431C9|nr:hypothetical protein [Amniculibacterium sp. G2-70]
MKTLCIKEILQILAILTLIFSCNSKSKRKEIFRPLTNGKDSILVPEFTIKIELNNSAEKKLLEEKETVKIMLELYGTPEIHIPEKYKYEFYNELGQIQLGQKSIELNSERVYTFKNLKINSDLISLLQNKTYNARIDIVSGRKSNKNNLLDCEHIDKNIDSLKIKITEISGKLIEET